MKKLPEVVKEWGKYSRVYVAGGEINLPLGSSTGGLPAPARKRQKTLACRPIAKPGSPMKELAHIRVSSSPLIASKKI
jgi:hypothetical protein